jgi:hypothetical protein
LVARRLHHQLDAEALHQHVQAGVDGHRNGDYWCRGRGDVSVSVPRSLLRTAGHGVRCESQSQLTLHAMVLLRLVLPSCESPIVFDEPPGMLLSGKFAGVFPRQITIQGKLPNGQMHEQVCVCPTRNLHQEIAQGHCDLGYKEPCQPDPRRRGRAGLTRVERVCLLNAVPLGLRPFPYGRRVATGERVAK